MTPACDPLKKMKETHNLIWWYMFNKAFMAGKIYIMMTAVLTAARGPSFSAIKIFHNFF